MKNTLYFLDATGNHRHINFGSVYLVKKPKFSQLLRYYVFSTTTGADHIFYFRTTNNNGKSLYEVDGEEMQIALL